MGSESNVEDIEWLYGAHFKRGRCFLDNGRQDILGGGEVRVHGEVAVAEKGFDVHGVPVNGVWKEVELVCGSGSVDTHTHTYMYRGASGIIVQKEAE